MAIAEQEQDPLLLSEAHLLTGLSRAWLDDLPSSLDHYRQAVEHFEATRSGHVDFRVGPNPGVVANVVSGLTSGWSGPRRRPRRRCSGRSTWPPTSTTRTRWPTPCTTPGCSILWRQDLAGVADSSRRAAGHRRGARLPDVAGPGARVARDGHGRIGRRRRRAGARRRGLRAVQGPVDPAGVLAGAAHDPGHRARHGRPRPRGAGVHRGGRRPRSSRATRWRPTWASSTASSSSS